MLTGKQGISVKHRLANFLFRYRTTPQSMTGVTPAELMVKRRLRTRLSLIKPNLAQASLFLPAVDVDSLMVYISLRLFSWRCCPLLVPVLLNGDEEHFKILLTIFILTKCTQGHRGILIQCSH